MDALYQDALQLLRQLISTPSFSKEEEGTAWILQYFLKERGIPSLRVGNNVWAQQPHFNTAKPTLLLNSHHDTVKPNKSYVRDPFSPEIDNGRLYGLGSNDAGGCLVALMAAFRHFYNTNLPYNLVLACSAEEEISGSGGISMLWPHLPSISCALVGEPTSLDLAVAEKGLMVLDCKIFGRSGHAAREEGENAIYKALHDIDWFRSFRFGKQSTWLGPVKMSVTMVQAGTQHNVVPDLCTFTVDVRTTDAYTNEEVLEIVRSNVLCEVVPRSTRLQPSFIHLHHPLAKAGLALGKKPYGSPTLSDQALMPVPSLKFGPGDSARSHTADEYILLQEIKDGIEAYIALIGGIQ